MEHINSETGTSSEKKLRLAIVQRVLPEYRTHFFNQLGTHNFQIQIFSGSANQSKEGIVQAGSARNFDHITAESRNLIPFSKILLWQPGLTKWLKEFDPDVLVTDINPKSLSGLIAARWMRRRGRPVLGWGLGLMPRDRMTSAIRSAIYKLKLRQLDGVIGYGSKAAEDYRRLGMNDTQVFTAYNAVASPEPAQDVVCPDEASSSEITVVFVGRLIASKEIDHLLLAVKNIESSVRLRIIGDGPELSNLQRLSDRLNLNAEFSGHQSGTALSELLYSSDVFVLPGAGGLAIQEALSHGLPVVATYADGTERDLVRDGRNGYLVEPGNIATLTTAMEKLISSPDLRTRMASESHRIAKEEINLVRMSAQFAHAVRTTHGNFKNLDGPDPATA